MTFARLAANPLDAAAWAVLSDELQSQGDARGELIALATEGRPQKLKVKLQKYLSRTLSDFARGLLEHDITTTFDHGLWATMTVHQRRGELDFIDGMREVLECPLAVLLREFNGQFSEARGPHCVVLSLERGAPALRKLVLASRDPWSASGLFVGVPALEEARLWNVEALEGHPTLRVLNLVLATDSRVEALQFPELRGLELGWLGEGGLPELRYELPSLRRLTVSATPEVIERVAHLPFAAQLERLTLRSLSSRIDALIAPTLLSRLAAFADLESFEWPGGPEHLTEQVRNSLAPTGGEGQGEGA
jgi:hypothetical protein